MTRDEWVNWQFGISDDSDANTVEYVKNCRIRYEKIEAERGWKASHVEKISDDSWLVELAHEDPFDMSFSPMVTKWCEENCSGGWNANDPVWWDFELETDAMAFKLAWGD